MERITLFYYIPTQVPYEIKNADNILSMDPYGSGIRVACDSKTDPKAISVLTLPFKTAVGFVVGIDVMTKNMDKFKVGGIVTVCSSMCCTE